MSRTPKRLPDGRSMLNLGSSARVAPGWNNLDFSWLVRIASYPRLCSVLHSAGLLSDERLERTRRADPDTLVWDLRRGIPFEDATFDVVYHSHFLEHLDRDVAPAFLRECFRVLKPSGRLRVVVPDFELLARLYLEALDDPSLRLDRHEELVGEMIDQMVVRTPRFRQEQHRLTQLAEHVVLGNTDRAGILHRWMYDEFSLTRRFAAVGLDEIRRWTHTTSGIDGWASFGLDAEPDGSPYMPFSLYLEGTRRI